MAKTVVLDADELDRIWLSSAEMIEAMGGITQKVANSAASAGATAAKRNIRSRIPKKTGQLRRGVYRYGERSKTKGKKVYELVFDRRMNSVFQKPVKNPGEISDKMKGKKYAYYPASVNFGYLTKEKDGLKYVKGVHFMEEGIKASTAEVQTASTVRLSKKVTEEFKKMEIK